MKFSPLCSLSSLLFNSDADPYARPLHTLALRVLRAAHPHALLGLAAGGLAAGQPNVALINDSFNAGRLDACFDLKLVKAPVATIESPGRCPRQTHCVMT